MYDDFINLGIYPKGNAVKQKLKCPKCSPTRIYKASKK